MPRPLKAEMEFDSLLGAPFNQRLNSLSARAKAAVDLGVDLRRMKNYHADSKASRVLQALATSAPRLRSQSAARRSICFQSAPGTC